MAMQKLQNLGLVDEVIDVPRRFKALPVKEGVSMLLQGKKLEYQKLVKRSEFFSKFNNALLEENVEYNWSIMALSGQKRLFESTQKAIENVENSADLCGDWQGFRYWIYNNYKTILNRMLKKGVRFRTVINHPSNDSAIEEFKNFARKYPNVEIRFFELHEDLLFLWIFDNKEIVFAKQPDDFQSRVRNQEQVLMSNAPAIIQMGQTYFEHVWENARPLKVDC